MSTPIHSLAEHRQAVRNIRVRLALSTGCVLVFAVVCFLAWEREWSGFGKFVGILGVACGLVAVAADLSALREQRRAMRRLERAHKKT